MKKIRSGQQRQSKTFVSSTCSDLFESYYLIEGVVKKLLQLSQLIYTTLVYEPQSRRLCVKMEQTYKRFPYSFSNLAIQLVEWNGETRNVCLYFVCLFVYYVRLTLSFLGLSLLFGWGEGKRDQEKDFTWETKEKKTKKYQKKQDVCLILSHVNLLPFVLFSSFVNFNKQYFFFFFFLSFVFSFFLFCLITYPAYVQFFVYSTCLPLPLLINFHLFNYN